MLFSLNNFTDAVGCVAFLWYYSISSFCTRIFYS